jgi:hypothetical protein
MRKILLLALSVIWGAFVFLPGSVLLGQAMLRTFVAILPMLVAIFLVNDGDRRWRRNLRRSYGTVMPIFIVVINAGSLLSIPYILTGILLVWPEIRTTRIRTRVVATGFVCLLLGGLAGINIWRWHHVPLPSDQEMIQHFERSRATFEELAQKFRNCRGCGRFIHESSPEIYALMKKAGVDDIGEASGQFGRWYPDPYSEETLEVLKYIYIRPLDEFLDSEEIMAILRMRLPTLFEGVAPLNDVLDVAQVTSPVRFDLGPDPDNPQWGITTIRYPDSFMKKGFCYYPHPPRIENGHILATGYSLTDKAYTRPGIRVFPSLDDYSADLQRYECVVKPIDTQWFIYLCRYAP